MVLDKFKSLLVISQVLVFTIHIMKYVLIPQYYLRTGTCKFGATCKFHHPRNGGGSLSNVPVNSYGYPLRPVIKYFACSLPVIVKNMPIYSKL